MEQIFRKNARARGFTMIELLTVIAIIGILMALLLPVLSTVRRNAKETATRSLIKSIETAIAAYEFDWGVYPPDGRGIPAKAIAGYPIASSSALYYYLTTPFRINPTKPDEVYATKDVGPYLDVPPRNQRFPGAASGQCTDIVDVWNRPLQYDNIRDPQANADGFDAIPATADAIEIRNNTTLVTPDPRHAATNSQNLQGVDIFSLGEGAGTQCTRPIANFKCVWEQ